MKTKFLIILIAFSVSNIFAQTDSLTFVKDIDNLNEKVSLLEIKIETIRTAYSKILQEHKSLNYSQFALKKENNTLKGSFETYKQNTETKIDSLQQVINSNSANIKTTADELGVKIEDNHKFTNQSITDLNKTVNSNSANIKITADELGVKIEDSHKFTKQSIADLNKTVSQNTLYWIIAVLVVALLVLLVFVLLRKQLFKQKTDLDSNLQETRKVLEEEGVKLDNKLIEVLETQLKIINSSNSGAEKEADHTLALKVADEIIRIQKNLTRMDEKTKGLKQLTASVKRIQDNFASNGYEIVEMLGKAFNDGMKVSANFVPDEDLETGQQIITRIIKPQVNYKGVMIQSAQIEVSQG